MILLRKYAAIFLVTVLTACGGGGGDTPAATQTSSTLTFQFQNAWGTLLRQNGTYPITLSGTASNATIGSYPVTAASGAVNQVTQTSAITTWTPYGETTPQTVLMVTRVYQFTALVHGYSLPQTLTDVAYYDPTTYIYLGGNFTDNSGNQIQNVVKTSSPPPATLTCCNAANTAFYQTVTAVGGSITSHDIYYNEATDTANSIIVNLPDTSVTGANRQYRLNDAATLTPLTEDLNLVAYVVTTGGTYPFNVTIKFHF